MSSSVENRQGQRRGNSRRRRGGNPSSSGGNSPGSGSNRRPRSRSQSRRGDSNLDPRRRLDEAKARARKEPAAPPSLWQRLVSLFTGKPATAGGSGRPGQKPKTQSGTNRQRKEPTVTPKRAPEPAGPDLKQRLSEVSSGKLYVGNLSYDATEDHLTDLFSGIGNVTSAEVVSNRRTHRSKGYAFVHMNTVDEARRAVEILHDKDFMGRKLIVSGARSTRELDSDDDDGDGTEPGGQAQQQATTADPDATDNTAPAVGH